MILPALIADAIDIKRNNKEFSLEYHPNSRHGPWIAHIGEEDEHGLREIFSDYMDYPEEAVENLIYWIQKQQTP